MENFMAQLKADLDTLMIIPYEEYLKLKPYLNITKYPKNVVLKSPTEIESKSRYVFEGLIGLFENSDNKSICRRIFSKSDIVCDFDSYLNEKTTNLSFIAYTDCIVAELTKQNEPLVVNTMKVFAELGIKINHRITSRDNDWKKIYWLKPDKRYDHLYKICPSLTEVKVKDICGILNLPERTVSRLRSKK